jgi:hypothetical protein
MNQNDEGTRTILKKEIGRVSRSVANSKAPWRAQEAKASNADEGVLGGGLGG